MHGFMIAALAISLQTALGAHPTAEEIMAKKRGSQARAKHGGERQSGN